MPCTVCKSPEAAFHCVDCADALCRQHAVGCQGCRKALCPDHIQRTPGGRILCNTCMKARNERHRQRRAEEEAARRPAAPAPSGGGGFSFQDLMSDLPPVPGTPEGSGGTSFEDLGGGMGVPLAAPRDLDDPRDDRNAGAHGLDEVPDPEVERKLAQLLGEDEQAVRVLAGSAPKPRPMWISGLGLGLLTWGVCYYIALNSAYNSFEPYASYLVAVLGLGGVAWSVSGLRNENEEAQARKLNWLGLVLASTAIGIALLQSRAT